MNVLPQFSYGMVVIGSLSMVGDGGGCEGCWEGVGRALGGRRVGRALGWRVVRVGLGVWFIGKSNRYIVAGIF